MPSQFVPQLEEILISSEEDIMDAKTTVLEEVMPTTSEFLHRNFEIPSLNLKN
jgi:hypothetical protein